MTLRKKDKINEHAHTHTHTKIFPSVEPHKTSHMAHSTCSSPSLPFPPYSSPLPTTVNLTHPCLTLLCSPFTLPQSSPLLSPPHPSSLLPYRSLYAPACPSPSQSCAVPRRLATLYCFFLHFMSSFLKTLPALMNNTTDLIITRTFF